jgi:uncharacterized membrane protein
MAMPRRHHPLDVYLPQVGCGILLFALATLCVIPALVVGGMHDALEKLHLSPATATLTLIGIFVGSLINLPLYRVNRGREQASPVGWVSTRMGWVPLERTRTQTIVAVNVGGCLIPASLAVFLTSYLLREAPQVQRALLLAVAVNVAACHFLARPMPGIGIALPAFIPVMLAVGMAWLLLAGEQHRELRAPLAFIAGVSGPLIGADLLNLRRFEQLSAGIISIGGAGTFDGIVVCSLLSAFLA